MALTPIPDHVFNGNPYRKYLPQNSSKGSYVFYKRTDQPSSPVFALGYQTPASEMPLGDGLNYVIASNTPDISVQVCCDDTDAETLVSIDLSVNGIDWSGLPTPIEDVSIPACIGDRATEIFVLAGIMGCFLRVRLNGSSTTGFVEVYST